MNCLFLYMVTMPVQRKPSNLCVVCTWVFHVLVFACTLSGGVLLIHSSSTLLPPHNKSPVALVCFLVGCVLIVFACAYLACAYARDGWMLCAAQRAALPPLAAAAASNPSTSVQLLLKPVASVNGSKDPAEGMLTTF